MAGSPVTLPERRSSVIDERKANYELLRVEFEAMRQRTLALEQSMVDMRLVQQNYATEMERIRDEYDQMRRDQFRMDQMLAKMADEIGDRI